MSHLEIKTPSKSLWRVSFSNPPINLMGGEMVEELLSLVEKAEKDSNLVVILFESSIQDYFLAHWDLTDNGEVMSKLPTGPTGMFPLLDLLIRISKLPILTISAIRGRARGIGSEFALATDIRFASENAIIGQMEVATGAIPGVGGVTRLARLVGRGRALEILAGAEDFDGKLAERYGYVNRAIPDDKFEEFIDNFIARVSKFDKQTIQELKQFVDPVTLPENEEFSPQLGTFLQSLGREEVQIRVKRYFELGLQQSGDFEKNLAEMVAKHR